MYINSEYITPYKSPQTIIYSMNSIDFCCDKRRKYKAITMCSLIFTFQYNSYIKIHYSIENIHYKLCYDILL